MSTVVANEPVPAGKRPNVVKISTTSRPPLVPVPPTEAPERTKLSTQQMPVTSLEKNFDRVSISVASSEAIDDDDDREALDRPLDPKLPSARMFAAQVVGQTIEILLGHRPVRQLQSWLAPGVYRSLTSRAGLAMRLHGPAVRTNRPVVHRMYVSHPRRRIAEVSTVAHDGTQIRAIALRLEIHRERWRVTALEIA